MINLDYNVELSPDTKIAEGKEAHVSQETIINIGDN